MRRSVVLACLLLGCATAQTPFQFTFVAGAAEPLEAIATALTGNGFSPASIERETGLIALRWEDTGVPDGKLAGVPATIVRRFTITAVKGPAAIQVTVRGEAQRCAQGKFTIGRHELSGTCEAASAATPQQQEELTRMGSSLQQALSATR